MAVAACCCGVPMSAAGDACKDQQHSRQAPSFACSHSSSRTAVVLLVRAWHLRSLVPEGPPPRHVVCFRNLRMEQCDISRKVSGSRSLKEGSIQRHMHAALGKPGCTSLRVFLP